MSTESGCLQCPQLTRMLEGALQESQRQRRQLQARDQDLRNANQTIRYLESKLEVLDSTEMKSSTCSLRTPSQDASKKYKEQLLALEFNMQVEHNKLRHEISSIKLRSSKLLQHRDSQISALKAELQRIAEEGGHSSERTESEDLFLARSSSCHKELEGQLFSLQEEVLKLGKVQKQLRQRVGQLQQQLVDAHSKLQQQRKLNLREKTGFMSKEEGLQAQADRYRELINKQQLECASLKEQKIFLQSSLSLLNNKAESRRKEYEVLSQSNQYYKEKLSRLELEAFQFKNLLEVQRLKLIEKDQLLKDKATAQQAKKEALDLFRTQLDQRTQLQAKAMASFQQLSLKFDRLCDENKKVKLDHEEKCQLARSTGLQLERVQRELKESRQQNSRLLNQLSEKDFRQSQVQDQEEEFEQRKKKMQEDLAEKQQEIERLRFAVQMLQTECRETEADRSRLSTIVQEAQKENDLLREQLQSKESDLDSAKEKLQSVQRELKTQGKRVDEEKEARNMAQDEADQLRLLYKKTIQECRNKSDELESRKYATQELQLLNCQLSDRLSRVQQALRNEQQTSLAKLEQVSEAMQEKQYALQEELKRVTQSSKREVNQLQRRLKESLELLEESSSKVGQAVRINGQLKQKLFSIQNRYIERLGQAQKDCRQMQCERAAMTLQLKTLRAEIVDKEVSDKQAKKLTLGLQKQIQTLRKVQADSCNQLKLVRSELGQSQRALAETREELRRQTKRTKATKEELGYLQREQEELREQVEYERKRNRHLQQLYLKYRSMRSPDSTQLRHSWYKSSGSQHSRREDRKACE